jgi:FkbM family methyltransferase
MSAAYKITLAILRRLPLAKRIELIDAVVEHLPEAAYGRLVAAGFAPRAIIDIGAYRGEWAKSVRQFFPFTPILMIEAQAEEEPSLKAMARELKRAQFRIALLASNDDQSIPFNVMATGSSIFAERSDVPRTVRTIKSITLDSLLSDLSLFHQAPLFLKLDIQGAELEALRGATDTLERTEVVQLEAALTCYNEGAPQAAEVIAFMAERGFTLWDIASFVRPQRPYLSQVDFVFVRENSQLRRAVFNFGVKASY